MNLEQFNNLLTTIKTQNELIDFCRKFILHGTPYIFKEKEDLYYEFRKRISIEFKIPFHEVYITGSAKLGFSPFKERDFDFESDIDVALVSPILFERIMSEVSNFQYQLRQNRRCIGEKELEKYRIFLEYTAIGWIRPDKLPISFQIGDLKNQWFSFFDSISYSKSEVGNYKVSAGVFKNYNHLEEYIASGVNDLKNKLLIRRSNGASN